MPEIIANSGDDANSLFIPPPNLIGNFISGIDDSFSTDGFGIVYPLGGGSTVRKYSDYGISAEVSQQATQLQDLADAISPVGGGVSYNVEGLVGPQGLPGKDGTTLILHEYIGLNSSYLTALPINTSQIEDLGTAADKLVYTESYDTYTLQHWREGQPAGDVNRLWRAAASDGDGSNLIVCIYSTGTTGALYTSSDSGANWTLRDPTGGGTLYYQGVASDSDGSHLVAVGAYTVYTSSNSGVGWTERDPAGTTKNWTSADTDSDGSFIILGCYDGVYKSSNSGVSWSDVTPVVTTDKIWGVRCDSTGTYLIAWYENRVYTSSNGGSSWTQRDITEEIDEENNCYSSCDVCDDGSIMIACSAGDGSPLNGRLFISTDYGVNWTEKQPNGDADFAWGKTCLSTDGTHALAAINNGRVYFSSDSGDTWTETQPAGDVDRVWGEVVLDSDGNTALAVGNSSTNGRVYTYYETSYSKATWAESDITSAARSLLDDSDSETQRATLGLTIGSDVQAWDAQLDDIAALAVTDGNFIVGDGANWVIENGDTARTSLGVGTGDSPQFYLVVCNNTPVENYHLVNKSYVDSMSISGDFWNNVAVATIANIDLDNDLEAGDVIDDYTLVEGDRVLVKEQTDATENGLYVVPASGSASRATDADSEVEILNKKAVPLNGSLTMNRFYFCTNASVELGVDDINFAELTLMTAHNTLSGIQGGTVGPPTEYYHLTAAEHTALAAVALLSFGIADDNMVQIDDADAAASDYCKLTANGIEGRSYAEVKSDLTLDNVENTAISTWAGSSNIVTVGTLTAGAIGAGFTEIATTYTAAKCTDATADNTAANETSHSDVLVDGEFASAGVMKTDGAASYSIGTIGIADNNIMEVDDADAADNDYAKFTANGLEGRSYSEVLSDLSGQAGGAFAWNSQNLTGVAALVIDDAGTIGSASDTDIMTLAADGTCTFSVFPVTPSAAPDADYEVANKKYVDDNAGGGGGASEITFKAKDRVGPSTSYATLDTVAGGSTPAEVIAVLDFDASSSEYVDFRGRLFSGYGGGGLTLDIVYSMSSDHDESTPHKVRWEAAIRRVNDDAEDINGAHSYSFNGVSDIVPSEVGEVSYPQITFTDGADMDSLAAGEEFILRIYRDHDHADDNATGDAEFWSVTITET